MFQAEIPVETGGVVFVDYETGHYYLGFMSAAIPGDVRQGTPVPARGRGYGAG